jgi:hypothetical protein
MAMESLYFACLFTLGVIGQAMPTEPGVPLPWFQVVGIGLVAVLGGYALLFIMLKVFPRSRRLGDSKKTQEPIHPKKTCPREDWPLIEIEESEKTEET